MKTIISLKYTSLLIIVIGLCLAFTSDKTAVTVTMLTLGVCMFILNELLPRLEGKLEIGPKGLSATLSEAKLVAQKSIQSSPPATLTLPKLQIKGGTQSAEISCGLGWGNPLRLSLQKLVILALQSSTSYLTVRNFKFLYQSSSIKQKLPTK